MFAKDFIIALLTHKQICVSEPLICLCKSFSVVCPWFFGFFPVRHWAVLGWWQYFNNYILWHMSLCHANDILWGKLELGSHQASWWGCCKLSNIITRPANPLLFRWVPYVFCSTFRSSLLLQLPQTDPTGSKPLHWHLTPWRTRYFDYLPSSVVAVPPLSLILPWLNTLHFNLVHSVCAVIIYTHHCPVDLGYSVSLHILFAV